MPGDVWWGSWRELPPPVPYPDCQSTDPDSAIFLDTSRALSQRMGGMPATDIDACSMAWRPSQADKTRPRIAAIDSSVDEARSATRATR